MTINILSFLDPQYLMGVIAERQDFGAERGKYIGTELFPRRNFPEQTVAWETQRRENRLAGIYTAKGKPVPGDDIGFKTYFENMLWIKAGKYLDPDIVNKIRDPGMVAMYKSGGQAPFAVQGIAERVAAKMNQYLTFIDDQIAAQEEYFAIKALTNEFRWPPLGYDGQPIDNVNYNPEWNHEGGKLEVEWPFHEKFVQNIWELEGVPASVGGTNRDGTQIRWTEDGADPRYDLEVIADMMLEEKGVDADGATLLMSRKALSYIAFLASVQRWLIPTTDIGQGDRMFADVNRVKEWIQSAFGFRIRLYDAKWTYLDGFNDDGSEIIRSVRFMPANKMVVIPPGETVGVMAQAPHETQGGDYVWGKTISVKRQDEEPYERWMSMSNLCWPLMTSPDALGVFTLW